jgi:hypothetical protein
MPAAEFRFYEELNDYLPASRRKRSFTQVSPIHVLRGLRALLLARDALSAPRAAQSAAEVYRIRSTRVVVCGVEVLATAFVLTSAAFADNGAIPKRYTCEDADVSPPLNWSDAPPGTKSFALIVDDPDAPDPRAPKMTWVHWVIENIPADTLSLPEGAAQRGLPLERYTGSMTGNAPATVALAHRSAGIGIFTSSTHSTRLSPVSTTRRKRSF